MAKKIFLGLLVALLTFFSSQVRAGYKVSNIGSGYDFKLNNQGKIAFVRWVGDTYPNGNTAIFVHDLRSGSTQQITQTGYDNYGPVINGRGDIAWLGLDKAGSGKVEVYWKPAGASVPSAITLNSLSDNGDLSISDDGKVAWDRFDGSHYQIFIWNGQKVTQISSGEFDHWSPQISPNGRYIAFVAEPESENISEIFRYDFCSGSAERITTTTNWSRYADPAVNDSGDIVWQNSHYVSGRYSYYYLYRRLNSAGATEVLSEDMSGWYPRISASGAVAWMALGPHSSQVFLNSGGVTKQITSISDVTGPWLNDIGDLVWQESSQNHDACKILLLKGNAISQISPNDSRFHYWPQINNRRDVVWQYRENMITDSVIYGAIPADITPVINLLLLQ